MFSPRAFWMAVVLWLGTGLAAQASFRIPPELENATEEETARYLQLEGDRSLREKIQVGKQRYQERLAFRQALADTMRTNRERRRAVISNQFATVPVARPGRSASHEGLLWLAALALVGVFAFLHFRLRRSRE
jgi:hypothetical protein